MTSRTREMGLFMILGIEGWFIVKKFPLLRFRAERAASRQLFHAGTFSKLENGVRLRGFMTASAKVYKPERGSRLPRRVASRQDVGAQPHLRW